MRSIHQLGRLRALAGPLAFVALLCGGSWLFAAGQDDAADFIFQNGAVYTMNPEQEWAQAVAVKGKKIVYVGDNKGVAAFKGDATGVIDLQGRMLMPGFVEGHIHPIMGAPMTRGVVLETNDHARLIEILKDYAATAPDRGLIHGLVRGFGWRYAPFPLTGPTKEDLDAIWPDLPVFLVAIDGHNGWVNSKALEILDVTKDTPDVVPGFSYFAKDAKTGEPTGYVVEGPAMQMALAKLGPMTRDYILESLYEWLPKAAAAGITTIFDAGMPILDTKDGFGIYEEIEKAGKLPFRVIGTYYDNNPEIDPIPLVKEMQKEHHTELIKGQVLKLCMDGVDSNGTAAMLEPYTDNPKSRGKTLFSAYVANQVIKRADAAGIDVHVHCIGDRATRQTLDAIEAAIRANPPRDRRHTIAHNQITDPADIPRFAKLGVIAEFSGQWHCRDDGYWDRTTLPRWGEDRANREYRMGEMLRQGVHVSLGTDWPAGGNSAIYKPLTAIEVAVTRQTPGKPDEVPLPPLEDRLTLDQALRANTMGTAYQIRMESEVGSIEVGKFADLIVLGQNLFKIDPHEISKTQIDLTMMNGRFTHGGEPPQ